MVVKCKKIKPDDLNYWNVKKSFNNDDIENIDDEERDIALSVNLLLKNKTLSQRNFLQLPSHLITSPNCQCHRSFHIFCTDLFHNIDKQDSHMIHIHPAPLNHERDPSHRILSSYRKSHQKILTDNDQETIITSRSEPCPKILTDNQLFERKLRVPPKVQPRTTSLNIPSTFQRSVQASIKYSPSIRAPKQPTPFVQLKIRALSVFDQSPSTSQLFHPRGPPPSPKTPTQESSMILLNPKIQAPLRAISLTPQVKYFHENEKKLINTNSVKKINYEDHAREYLSASDASDNDEDDDDDDEDKNKVLAIKKLNSPGRTQSVSRPGTSLRDRLLTHHASRYLSLAEVYYSTLDVQKSLMEKSRRRLRSQARLLVPTNDNEETATIVTTKTTTTATKPIQPLPESKSVFGFSKTASSMHFGHAAGRLGLHGSFEKWPQSLSRRTPIERKQEVTTLRLVTLPLVTS